MFFIIAQPAESYKPRAMEAQDPVKSRREGILPRFKRRLVDAGNLTMLAKN